VIGIQNYALLNRQNAERHDYPARKEYKAWKKRLAAAEIAAIIVELNRLIDKCPVQTSSWMPGSDWRGTVFEPIWSKACQFNVDTAAMCFGLILWEVMMDRPDTWSFGRYNLKDVPIKGLTYFRVQL
jgi:hypothetical protein